ncbi:hypothetical protein ABZP36_012861 [Zizania latifolia]
MMVETVVMEVEVVVTIGKVTMEKMVVTTERIVMMVTENINGRGGRGAATKNNKGGGGNSGNEGGGGGNSGGRRSDPIVCSRHDCKNYGNGKVISQYAVITSGTQASGIPKPKGKP